MRFTWANISEAKLFAFHERCNSTELQFECKIMDRLQHMGHVARFLFDTTSMLHEFEENVTKSKINHNLNGSACLSQEDMTELRTVCKALRISLTRSIRGPSRQATWNSDDTEDMQQIEALTKTRI